jgi:hypothetical protein
MATALLIIPASDFLPAPLFASTPKAAQRFIEFFTAQINNDYTRLSYLNATRRIAACRYTFTGQIFCGSGW